MAYYITVSAKLECAMHAGRRHAEIAGSTR